MKILITGLILVSLAAAGGTALLVNQFLKSESQSEIDAPAQKGPDPEPKVFVLTANGDLPAGTTISGGDLKWQTWPEGIVNRDFVISPEEDKALFQEYVGAVVRKGIVAGTPMNADMVFHRPDAGFLTGILSPGMRAVAIEIEEPHLGAAGFVLPGDHVDVILIHDVRTSYPGEAWAINDQIVQYAAETILENIRVVAVDQEFDDFDGEAVKAETITLELTPKGAEVVSLATEMGQIYLSLRSLAVEEPHDDRYFTSDYEISRALSSAIAGQSKISRTSDPQTERTSRPTLEIRKGVKIYRGVEGTVSEPSE